MQKGGLFDSCLNSLIAAMGLDSCNQLHTGVLCMWRRVCFCDNRFAVNLSVMNAQMCDLETG